MGIKTKNDEGPISSCVLDTKKSIHERSQQGVPFETLYRLKYAFVGEIVFLRFRTKVLSYDHDI